MNKTVRISVKKNKKEIFEMYFIGERASEADAFVNDIKNLIENDTIGKTQPSSLLFLRKYIGGYVVLKQSENEYITTPTCNYYFDSAREVDFSRVNRMSWDQLLDILEDDEFRRSDYIQILKENLYE